MLVKRAKAVTAPDKKSSLPKAKAIEAEEQEKTSIPKIRTCSLRSQNLVSGKVKTYIPKIRIIGIGGGGVSIVAEIAQKVKMVECVAVDTDRKALMELPKELKRFRVSQTNTGSLRATCLKRVEQLFQEIGFCVLVSCLGGEAAFNISPIFAETLRRCGVITLGIFVLPFEFEGEEKAELAKFSLQKIKQSLNASIIVSNQKLFNVINKNASFKDAFSIVNQWVVEGLEGLIEMFYSRGLISIDLADLKMILAGRGRLAFLNTVQGNMSKSIQGIARRAVYNRLSPYLAYKAKRVLFNITAGENLSINGVSQIGSIISKSINPQAKIIFGITQDKNYRDKVRITLLASGCRWQGWGEGHKKP